MQVHGLGNFPGARLILVSCKLIYSGGLATRYDLMLVLFLLQSFYSDKNNLGAEICVACGQRP